MVVYFKANLYSFTAILSLCLVFFCLTFWNANKLAEANALSQSLEELKIVPGQVTDVRKIEEIFVVFPRIRHYVDYEYGAGTEKQNYSFRCRSMSACYWIKVGKSDIITAQNGRYALPLELKNSLPTYRKHILRKTRGSFFMSLMTLVLTVICAVRIFRK